VNKSKVLIKISSPALGDTLCSTPTIRKVSNSYGFKVDVMTQRPDIFKNNLYVNNILEFIEDDVEGYDEVFETYNHCIKVNKNMNSSEFYDKPMEIKLMNFDARQLHAMGIGITLYPEEMHYDYFPNDQTEDSKKITKDFLVFHITESWPSRTWTPEKWQRLVDLVKQNTDLKIVTVGKSHLETAYHGDIKKGIIDLDNIDYNYCDDADVDSFQDKISENRSLSELWHIINNSFALITFDSGPMHLAGTTDTNIIEMGSNIRPERSAPYRKGTQDYKFYFVGGECDIFCASDLKYSVKEWGTINSTPYLPECQEKYDDFYCQPTLEQVFFKILEVAENERGL
jgi:ADP-heptose:LPS heptosyltransferase